MGLVQIATAEQFTYPDVPSGVRIYTMTRQEARILGVVPGRVGFAKVGE
jgi:hypothetical protein